MSKLQPLPENSEYFQIVGIHLDAETMGVCLELMDPIAKVYYELDFAEPLFLSVSKTEEDDDGCYQIGEIKVSRTEAHESALSNLGYQFKMPEVGHPGATFHLHVEGDLCVDIVSTSFETRGPLVANQKARSIP